MKTHPWLLGLSLLLLSCATTRVDSLHAESDEPILLTSSGALELHVRDGRIVEVVPATETSDGARARTIRTLDELRASWQQAVGAPLPESDDPQSIEVNGWSGLECVRRGQACGRQPDDAPRALVVIRFR